MFEKLTLVAAILSCVTHYYVPARSEVLESIKAHHGYSVINEGCIDGVPDRLYISTVPEDLAIGTELNIENFASPLPVKGSQESISIQFNYDANEELEYLSYELGATVEGVSPLSIVVGKDLNQYPEKERKSEIIFTMNIMCPSGSNQIDMECGVTDINDSEPSWNKDEININVPSTWPRTVHLNYGDLISVSDEDYLEENANIQISIETCTGPSPPLRFELENSADAQAHVKHVSIFAEEGLLPGDYACQLLASDGVNSDTTTFKLSVLNSGVLYFEQPNYAHDVTLPTEGIIDFEIKAVALGGVTNVVYQITEQSVDYIEYDSNINKFQFTRQVTEKDVETDKFPGLVLSVTGDGASGESVSDSTSFTINFVDLFLGDEPPSFDKISYDLRVEPDHKEGSKIVAPFHIDKKGAENVEVTLEPDDYFSIGFENGAYMFQYTKDPDSNSDSDPGTNAAKKFTVTVKNVGTTASSSATITLWFPLSGPPNPPEFNDTSYSVRNLGKNIGDKLVAPFTLKNSENVDLTMVPDDYFKIIPQNEGNEGYILEYLKAPNPEADADEGTNAAKEFIIEATNRETQATSAAPLTLWFQIEGSIKFSSPTYSTSVAATDKEGSQKELDISVNPSDDVVLNLENNDLAELKFENQKHYIVFITDPDPAVHAKENFIRELTISASKLDMKADASLIIYFEIPEEANENSNENGSNTWFVVGLVTLGLLLAAWIIISGLLFRKLRKFNAQRYDDPFVHKTEDSNGNIEGEITSKIMPAQIIDETPTIVPANSLSKSEKQHEEHNETDATPEAGKDAGLKSSLKTPKEIEKDYFSSEDEAIADEGKPEGKDENEENFSKGVAFGKTTVVFDSESHL